MIVIAMFISLIGVFTTLLCVLSADRALSKETNRLFDITKRVNNLNGELIRDYAKLEKRITALEMEDDLK